MSLSAAERKREGSKKEKKRRLIMRDSESDEEDDGQDSSPPRKKKATSLNPVKQKKEGDADQQEVVDEELKIDKKKGTGSRDLKQNSSRPNWLALLKEGDDSDSGSDRKKAEGKRNTSEEVLVEKERIARLDTGKQRKEMYTEKDGEVDTAVKEREEGFTFKKNGIEKQTIEVEPKVDRKRVLSSDFIKKRREDAESEEKKVTGKRKVDDDEKRPMRRASQRRNESEEIKVEKKWVVKADIEQRDKKTSIDYGSYMEEYKFNKKWAAIPVVFKRREAVGADVKKVKELDGDELDEKRFASLDNKKKDTKVGSDSTADRKRSRETLDADINLKRIKKEFKQSQDQCEVTDGKKIKQGHHEHGDERAEPKVDQVLALKLVVLSGGQMDSLKEKSSLGKSEKTSKPETESVRWMQRSEHRTLRKLKDNSVRGKRADHRILPEKGIRVQGKGGVLTVRPNNKKGAFEKAKESISTSSLGKNKSYMKSSLAKKQEFCDSKTDLKNKVLSSRNPDIACKGEGSSSSKAPLLTIQNQKEATERRATVRRKITDQIKGILLSAGWKIDLRPRRGKNYEDQVYIPPTGGGGYWSITKAYDAFEKELNHADGDKNKDLYGKSSKMSADGACSSSSAIPAELLSMLKRNIVKKRRRRIVDEETEGGRNKKVKRITKMKHYKNKNSKVKIAGVKGRKKPSSLVRSKAKDPTGKSNTKQRGRTLLVRGSNQETDTHDDGYVPYEWKRTVLSWMIDLRIVSLNGKVKYMNKKRTRAMLEGHIVRDGILCGCCSKILTVSKFEIHAGSKLHQPYENVFVEDSEKSLLQCLLDAWETQDEFERRGFYIVEKECVDPSDDTCGICGDGGDLICCDGCPSTFHLSCLGIEMLPPGDWYCTNCSCRFCRLVSKASAQGSGVPISPLFSCYQCEEKYHHECIPKEDAISTVSDNSPASFCGNSCRKVFRRLQKLLGVKNDMDAGFSWCLIRRLDEDSPSGLSKRAECNAKIAVALAVMDECFLPIIDQRSGFNRIHNIVYNRGSNFNRLNYRGFYTFTLERGDDIISAASVRIHGTRLAEMPFIGTRNMYRRQGMCRRLLSGIESALCSLGIKKLIIPAISELTDTWTTVFGFKPLDMSQEEVKSMNMLVFPGTGLLQKPLLKKNSSQSADEAGKLEPRIKDPYTAEIEPESSVLSSVGANLHPSNVVHARDDAITVLDCCVPSTSDVAPESFNSPQNSGFQAPEHKSPENAADSILFVQPEAVFRDEQGKGDKGQVDSFDVVKTKLPCKDIVHNNDDLEIEDTSAVINSQAVGETSAQDTSEANTGGNDLHNPVSSLESISNAFAHNKGPVDSYALHNLASSLEPGKGDKGQVDSYDVTKTKLPFEDILHYNDDLEVEDAAAVINSQAVGETSVHYASEANAGGNVLHNPASSLESISNASDHNTSEAIHDLRTEVAKRNANDEDAKPNTNGVGRSLTAPFGKESQASNGSCANGNLITSPVCASSGHVLEVSGGEKPYQQNSKPISQSRDFPDEALSFDLHHSSVNAFCSSSLPDPSDSSNDHVLKKSHETSNGLCSFRLIPYILTESSKQCYASDIVGKSPGVTLEPVSSTSGVKSCNIPAVSPRALPLMPDAGNNTLDMVEKAVTVQHELKVANEATSGISVEPKAACSEAECDTGTSKGDSDAAKPTHAFSVGSSHSALELVKVSLGNVSESADGSPDVDI